MIYEKLTGDDNYLSSSRVPNPPLLKEKQELDSKVELIMKEVTPMVYIDGFTSRDKWVD